MSNEFIDSNIRGNRVQSALLVLAMVVILVAVGMFLAGITGLVVALGVCAFMILFGPAVSPSIVLRMYKAHPVHRDAAPGLFDLFAELVRRAELPVTPVLHYVPSRTLNAFAVGNRTGSAVAITDGLLRVLNDREVAGVLAHEISHIRHRDMHVLGIADVVSRVTGTLSQFGQLMIFLAIPALFVSGSFYILAIAIALVVTPMLSNLLQLALSRSREFNADLGAVALTADAEGLSSALAKLERITTGTHPHWGIPGRPLETIPAILRTHPPTEERIRRIRMAGDSLGRTLPPIDQTPWVDDHRVPPLDRDRVRYGPRWHLAGLWY